jgi:hypothetical protein
MTRKLRFYERYGVQEYYMYDPDHGQLSGWQRQGRRLEKIAQMDGWVSPLLGIRFTLVLGELELYRPDGKRFATYLELVEQAAQAQQQAAQAQQRADAMAARLRALGIDPEEV